MEKYCEAMVEDHVEAINRRIDSAVHPQVVHRHVRVFQALYIRAASRGEESVSCTQFPQRTDEGRAERKSNLR